MSALTSCSSSYSSICLLNQLLPVKNENILNCQECLTWKDSHVSSLYGLRRSWLYDLKEGGSSRGIKLKMWNNVFL